MVLILVQTEQLMYELKEKLNISDRRQKVQILNTCARSIFSQPGIRVFLRAKLFGQTGSSTEINAGLLSLPPKQMRNRISDDMQEKVKASYKNDEVGRMCPGKKDSVKVTTEIVMKEKVQKSLLLINLHDIYVQFNNKTDEKVGFSTLCEMKPKWCITVGASGTHSVCICAKHQNAKLMIAAVNKNCTTMILWQCVLGTFKIKIVCCITLANVQTY